MHTENTPIPNPTNNQKIQTNKAWTTQQQKTKKKVNLTWSWNVIFYMTPYHEHKLQETMKKSWTEADQNLFTDPTAVPRNNVAKSHEVQNLSWLLKQSASNSLCNMDF